MLVKFPQDVLSPEELML